jgi:predicted metal-dependent phosphoesterase TrpH
MSVQWRMFGLPPNAQPPRGEQPAASLQRVDLHTHTMYSYDSSLPLEVAIAGWLEAGITCVAVTDHNTIAAARVLQEQAPLRIIVGEEIKTCEGEVIGLFLKEEIPPYLTPEATIERIHAQGGLVMVPHPFDRLRGSRLSATALLRVVERLDMLEVFNSRTTFPSDNRRAEAFARHHGLHMVVGSDSHTASELGRSYVEMPDFQTPQEFLTSLRAGRLVRRRSSLLVHARTRWEKWRAWVTPKRF